MGSSEIDDARAALAEHDYLDGVTPKPDGSHLCGFVLPALADRAIVRNSCVRMPGHAGGHDRWNSRPALLAHLRAALAELDRVTAERDEMAAAGRTVVECADEMRAEWAETEARLLAQVEALTAERDHARAALRWRPPETVPERERVAVLLVRHGQDLCSEGVRGPSGLWRTPHGAHVDAEVRGWRPLGEVAGG